MNTLILSPDARSQLAGQVTQNGTFIHALHAANGLIIATAYVTVEQCEAAVEVRVELGDSVNFITLARRADTAERVACFLEELANGATVSMVPEIDEHLLVGDLESTLRDAVRRGQGAFYLPVEELDALCLLLHPATSDPHRAVFRFELADASLTLPLLLPTDRTLAYELLAGCVRELVANYRSSAA